MQFTSHSKIEEFPPNPIIFPKFYNCEELIFVLNPGDMLYIPPKWFHWVFSYPNENNENLAASFKILDLYNKNVYNEFYFNEPFVLTLNKENNNFLNLSFQKFLKDEKVKELEMNCFVTKNKTIVPVQKNKNDLIQIKKMTKTELIDEYNKKLYNISIPQDEMLANYLNVCTPEIIKRSFLNNEIKKFLWINLFKNKNSYIETGLHYDITHNILTQINGTKVVRLYKPSDAKNLYLQPMYSL